MFISHQCCDLLGFFKVDYLFIFIKPHAHGPFRLPALKCVRCIKKKYVCVTLCPRNKVQKSYFNMNSTTMIRVMVIDLGVITKDHKGFIRGICMPNMK